MKHQLNQGLNVILDLTYQVEYNGVLIRNASTTHCQKGKDKPLSVPCDDGHKTKYQFYLPVPEMVAAEAYCTEFPGVGVNHCQG